jgi:hypothetical protein
MKNMVTNSMFPKRRFGVTYVTVITVLLLYEYAQENRSWLEVAGMVKISETVNFGINFFVFVLFQAMLERNKLIELKACTNSLFSSHGRAMEHADTLYAL